MKINLKKIKKIIKKTEWMGVFAGIMCVLWIIAALYFGYLGLKFVVSKIWDKMIASEQTCVKKDVVEQKEEYEEYSEEAEQVEMEKLFDDELLDRLIQAEAELYDPRTKQPSILYLKQALKDYVAGVFDSSGTIGLEYINKRCLKGELEVLEVNQNEYGGNEIYFRFKERGHLIFWAWVYVNAETDYYDLRGIELVLELEK